MRNSVNMLLKTSRFWLQQERKKDMHVMDMKNILFSYLESDLRKIKIVPNRIIVNNFQPYFKQEHSPELHLNIDIPIKTELETLQNQIKAVQYQANSSIEDRLIINTLKSLKAEIISVFDGHGGDKLSEYCANNMVELLDSFIQANKDLETYINNFDKLISDALNWVYIKLDHDFYENVYKEQTALNNRKIKNVGSCGLTIVIYEQKIYVANCGDSEAIAVLKNQHQQITFKELNTRLSVNNPQQRQRLKRQFPLDQDIVVQQSNGSFYIKGRLQPTRALGDYHLKYEHLFKGKGEFRGPYIKCDPEISIFNIEKDFKSIVVASDGVWDFIDKRLVAETSLEQNPHQAILERTLSKIAEIHKKTIADIKQIPQGRKRDFHDDISVAIVSLGTSSKLIEKRILEEL